MKPGIRNDPRGLLEDLLVNRTQFLAFVERRVGDRALAEDVLQESFARAVDKIDALREGESVVAWFYRVLRNGIVDLQRRRSASQRALASLASELDEPATDGPVRDAICQCVSRLTATLKPEYRDALRRVEVDGVPVKDFAAEAGISSGNAGVRIFRAREALRRQVIRSCGACAEHGCVDCGCGRGAAT